MPRMAIALGSLRRMAGVLDELQGDFVIVVLEGAQIGPRWRYRRLRPATRFTNALIYPLRTLN